MKIKFFCFDVNDGYPFCILSELPDNYMTMQDDNEVVYKRRVIASGVKFGSTVDYFWNADGFDAEADSFGEYKFRYINGEFHDIA